MRNTIMKRSKIKDLAVILGIGLQNEEKNQVIAVIIIQECDNK